MTVKFGRLSDTCKSRKIRNSITWVKLFRIFYWKM
jgi:hypothetical protein